MNIHDAIERAGDYLLTITPVITDRYQRITIECMRGFKLSFLVRQRKAKTGGEVLELDDITWNNERSSGTFETLYFEQKLNQYINN